MVFSQSLLVESLQASLDHERSMRVIDEERFAQVRDRLERQVEFVTHRSEQELATARKVQARAEAVAKQMEKSRDMALEQLRAAQMELLERESDGTDAREWEHTCRRLEHDLDVVRSQREDRESEIQELRRRLEEIAAAREREKEEEQSRIAVAAATQRTPDATAAEGSTSEMSSTGRELAEVRIRLADAERQVRQLRRKQEEDADRHRELVCELERANLERRRLDGLRSDHAKLRSRYEDVAAVNAAWKSFGRTLERQMRGSASAGTAAASGGGESDGGSGPLERGPPEVTTVMRYLERTESESLQLRALLQEQRQECQRLRELVTTTQDDLMKRQAESDQMRLERDKFRQQIKGAQTQIATLRAREGIAEREMSSLRELLRTFNEMPPGAVIVQAGSGPRQSTSAALADVSDRTLQVGLDAARERIELLEGERERLTKELDESQQVQQSQEEEIEKIRTKFGLLKQALERERAKVQEAEDRANAAQALAGKGSFNAETTQVLHLKETPLAQALKEEIQVLKRQLEAATSRPSSASRHGTPLAAGPDPEKLNRRLKENFKEQIALFREGVYLMTGYKVDMLPTTGDDGSNRPTFRVRSVFAEREEDHLMFKWPKADPATSLDLLETEFARILSTTPAYAYMTKFHSLPAFLASTQLSLFEKQTVML